MLFRSTSPVTSAIVHMQKYFATSIKVNQLAQIANLSVYHFSRLFKTETGYAPYEYLIMLRINEAKYYLKNTILPIKEIAFSVGFHSESSFVTSFKQHTTYTPSQFRKLDI